MSINSKADLGRETMGKLILKMSIPAILAQIINVLYNIVDRIYIGRIPDAGSLALTGVGVAFPIIIIISAFSSLIGMGGAPKMAIAMGEGDNKRAEKILGNCTSSIVLLSIIITIIVLVFQRDLLMLLGASENTIEYASDYLGIYAMGTIFVQFVLALNPFITTQGFASISMKTTLIGAITNIILDPIFIFSFGLGVKGAAIATVISQTISAVYVLKFLTGNKTVIKIKKSALKIDSKLLLSIMALGVSPFVMYSTESIIAICFNTSLKAYGGDIAVGAMTILSSCMQFLLLPLFGLTQGAQPIISYNYGANDLSRVRSCFKIILKASLGYTIVFWAFVMVFPEIFVTLFTSDEALSLVSAWAIRIYLFGGALMGLQIACQQALLALGQAKISLFLAVLRKIILLIPLIYILPTIMPESLSALLTPPEVMAKLIDSNKAFAVFFAEPVADVIAIIVTGIMFKIQFNKVLKEAEKRIKTI